jgi:hypothetical protein
MYRSKLLAFIVHCLVMAMVALPATAATQPEPSLLGPAAGQYTAEFDRASQRWRLLTLRGSDTDVSAVGDCLPGSSPPDGLWLLSRDAQGVPTLFAPSITALPAGHPGRIRLAACGDTDDTGEPQMGVPEALLEWLVERSGAVLVK